MDQSSSQVNRWVARWLGEDLHGPVFAAYRQDGFYVEGSTRDEQSVPTLLGVWDGTDGAHVVFTDSKEQVPLLYDSQLWDMHASKGINPVREYLRKARAGWPSDSRLQTRINERARVLTETEPQVHSLHPVYVSKESKIGSTRTWGWVDPKQIVLTPRSPRWAEFDYRPERTAQLITQWMNPDDDEAAGFVKTMKKELIALTRIPGPDGALYVNEDNGNHRVHAARITELPLIWAKIKQPHYPPDILAKMHNQPDWQHAYHNAYPATALTPPAAPPQNITSPTSLPNPFTPLPKPGNQTQQPRTSL